MSIRWLLPDSVRRYIERHGLFLEERKADQDAKAIVKDKQVEGSSIAGSSGNSGSGSGSGK
jgi:hypothetical protein